MTSIHLSYHQPCTLKQMYPRVQRVILGVNSCFLTGMHCNVSPVSPSTGSVVRLVDVVYCSRFSRVQRDVVPEERPFLPCRLWSSWCFQSAPLNWNRKRLYSFIPVSHCNFCHQCLKQQLFVLLKQKNGHLILLK